MKHSRKREGPRAGEVFADPSIAPSYPKPTLKRGALVKKCEKEAMERRQISVRNVNTIVRTGSTYFY
jgi:hypothetical protein